MTARIVVALAVLVCWAPAAQAGWKVDRALEIAQVVWKPECGELSVRFGHPRDGGDIPSESGGWAWAGTCKIGIDASQRWEFEPLCQVILHEAGHVAGLGHSDNPRSVMRAEFFAIHSYATIRGRTVSRWDGIDRRCLGRGREFLAEVSARG